jgi:hypothetical protein
VDSFFEFVQACVSAAPQDACGIADAAAMESHGDQLLFDAGETPFGGWMQEECLVGTVGMVTARALLGRRLFPRVVLWSL